MNKIKVKVVDYDVDSDSIIVAFASDESSKSIDEYETYAYQPTMYAEPNNPELVLKEVARCGVSVIEDQQKSEQFKKEEVIDKYYSSLVGKEFEYDLADLQEVQAQEVEVQEVVIEDILQEILIDDDTEQ